MNRCIICDFTKEEGSEFAYRSPGISSVREHSHGDFLCDECATEVDDNLTDLSINDEDEG